MYDFSTENAQQTRTTPIEIKNKTTQIPFSTENTYAETTSY